MIEADAEAMHWRSGAIDGGMGILLREGSRNKLTERFLDTIADDFPNMALMQ
jgi:hypothetical protein